MKINWTMMTSVAVGLTMGVGSMVARAAQEETKEVRVAPLVKGLKDLKELNHRLVGMAERSGAATVALVSRGGGGTGSGVVVSKDGLILTAAHVVDALSDEVIVIFPDGSRKDAKKLGADFDRDGAMVQITDKGSYPHVELGKSDGLLRNAWCVAMGHPGGFDPMRTPPLRLGRVLRVGDFVVTDCAVVGGDSGGPLFDADGKVIGIHSNIGATLSENRHVPVSVFRDQWDTMKSGEQSGKRFRGRGDDPDPDRPMLGVRLGESAEDGGVILNGIMEGSPAEKAGLKEGDVLVSVNGRKTNSAEELIGVVGKMSPGRRLRVGYRRDGEEKQVRVRLGRLGDLIPDMEESEEEAPEEEKPVDPKAMKEFFEEGLKNGGMLELTPEMLEELGGMDALRKGLQEMAKQMGPKKLNELLESRLSFGEDEFFASSMKALRPVVAKAGDATVIVLVNGKPASLGTVVSDRGWVLTKDTETRKGRVQVLVKDKPLAAKLLQRFPKRDLALYKVESKDLRPVQWAPQDSSLRLGALLTAAGTDEDPLGIGLVSVKSRVLADVGFLGIQMADAEQGVRVKMVVPDGPAAKAGLKKDDVILSINGEEFEELHEFGQRIRTYRAGDAVTLKMSDGEEERELRVELAARPARQSTGRFQRMNEMSGPLSKRLSGFPQVLQHDIPLDPSMCGGPLLDLDGRCVGINVSRAGRVKTLAIPAGDIAAMLESVGEEAPEVAKAQMAEREKLRAEIEEIRRMLNELEARLEKVDGR